MGMNKNSRVLILSFSHKWIWINIDGLAMDILGHAWACKDHGNLAWKGLKQHGRECKGAYEFPAKCGI